MARPYQKTEEELTHDSTRNRVNWGFTSQGAPAFGHDKSEDIIPSNIYLDEFHRVACFCCCCGLAENDGTGTCCGYSGKLCCCRTDTRLGMPIYPGCTFLSLCGGMFAHARLPSHRELPPVMCCGWKSHLIYRRPRRLPPCCQYLKCGSCSDGGSFLRDMFGIFWLKKEQKVMETGEDFCVIGHDGEIHIEAGPEFETEAERDAREAREAAEEAEEEEEEEGSESDSEGS